MKEHREFNQWPKLPSGKRCPDCGADWEPVCPTRNCAGRSEPLRVLAGEKDEGVTKRYA